MFSGIVESTSTILRTQQKADTVTLWVTRPAFLSDLRRGDSVAVNGICLTVEEFNDKELQFTLGAETLKITGWTAASLLNRLVNLEGSLRYGDRIHGHLVSGHVDVTGHVAGLEKGESWNVRFEVPHLNRKLIWQKGSITVNGVSLTVNTVSSGQFEVCLIPETLSRTQLHNLQIGDTVNIEYDSWAKAFVNFQEQREATP